MIIQGIGAGGIGDPGATASARHPRAGPPRRSPVHLVWNIIVLVVVGLIAGFVARAVIPGKQAMGIGATILLGIIGSLVGNFLASLIFHGDLDIGTSGIIGSIVGAIIVLGVYVMATGRRRAVNH
jgi:uncharacterized membrane protein YeaQ/YmgE (transglycosylase-associated protein family)